MGVYLSEPNTQKHYNEGMKNGITFCSAQMQGISLLIPGWRKNMEDAAIHALDIGDDNSIFAVFDGHGGPQVSKYVEKIFIDELKSVPEYKSKDYQKALYFTFKKVDQKISSRQGQQQLRALKQDSFEGTGDVSNGTGCTANVVLITKTHFYIANAGDSRSVLCRAGKAIDLSFDHKPQSREQQERIRKAGGYIQMGRVNGGLNLTRSFGDFNYKKNSSLQWNEQMITCKPDIKVLQRNSSDEFIIVGCDGIWQRYVQCSQGLIDIVIKQMKIQKQNKKIMQNILNQLLAKQTSMGIGCDNMTAVLIRFNQS